MDLTDITDMGLRVVIIAMAFVALNVFALVVCQIYPEGCVFGLIVCNVAGFGICVYIMRA